jgi:chemotaxis protein CheD
MNQNNTHFLYPAALFASREPYVINTILGSCVAVCLYDPTMNSGGMTHYMLPLWNGEGLASPKYGNIAIEKLVGKMKHYGSRQANLKAKVFGGGEVIEVRDTYFNIGKRNIKMAYDMLAEYNIPVIGASTGGKMGRKLIFDTYTGQVKQRYVKRQEVK